MKIKTRRVKNVTPKRQSLPFCLAISQGFGPGLSVAEPAANEAVLFGQRRVERQGGRPARSVAHLVTQQVDRNRMLVQGMGFNQPIADNATAEGRAENRRVELYILPKTT